jgi:CheY-like chemotaxis protein
MAHILVIDDDVAVRNAIRLILQHKGHGVVVAEGGQRGVEAIEAYAFDAVIVDIFMPGMDGLQTIKCLRQHAPKVAIIAMSGYAFRETSRPVPDFLKMACDLGATCSLRKPFKAWEIIRAVETCCADVTIEEELAREIAPLAEDFVPDCSASLGQA